MTAWAGYSWSGQRQVSRLNMAQALALVLICTGSHRSMQRNTCWPALRKDLANMHCPALHKTPMPHPSVAVPSDHPTENLYSCSALLRRNL